jgi:hypothetical protein
VNAVDEIEMLRRYGDRLGATAPPDVDVTANVMATLRREVATGGSASVMRPLMIAAAAGWLVAATCGIFAQQAWVAVEDPLGALVAPFVVALQ